MLHIVVHNPKHVCRNVTAMAVDCHPVDGPLLPGELSKGDHQVEVWLGPESTGDSHG